MRKTALGQYQVSWRYFGKRSGFNKLHIFLKWVFVKDRKKIFIKYQIQFRLWVQPQRLLKTASLVVIQWVAAGPHSTMMTQKVKVISHLYHPHLVFQFSPAGGIMWLAGIVLSYYVYRSVERHCQRDTRGRRTGKTLQVYSSDKNEGRVCRAAVKGSVGIGKGAIAPPPLPHPLHPNSNM